MALCVALGADEKLCEPRQGIACQLLPLDLMHVLAQVRLCKRWTRWLDPRRRFEHTARRSCRLERRSYGLQAARRERSTVQEQRVRRHHYYFKMIVTRYTV